MITLTAKPWASIEECSKALSKQTLALPWESIRDSLLSRFWRGELGSVLHPASFLTTNDVDEAEVLLAPEDLQGAYRTLYGCDWSLKALEATPYTDFDAKFRREYLEQIRFSTAIVSCVMVSGKPALKPPMRVGTMKAETHCQHWLQSQIGEYPNDPPPYTKDKYREAAMLNDPKLTRRGFDRAWEKATEDAPGWRRPGPRVRV